MAACAGSSAHPTDYLQFFAPGNREAQRPDEPPPEKKAPGGGGAELAQLTRRFMVYVHSKMMIVDDEVRCGCGAAACLGPGVFGFGSAAYLGLLRLLRAPKTHQSDLVWKWIPRFAGSQVQ